MRFSILATNGRCSLMICWFLLVPAGVPVLVSLLLSFFLRKGVLFHHNLLVPLGSGWGSGACLLFFSLLWFRCLSPFFSFLSFLKKGVLFHHDLLAPPGSGWGSSACLPCSLFFLSSRKGFCSIMICWFFLVPAGVPVLVSLLLSSFFPQERGSVPS